MSRARTLADLFNTDGNLNLSPVETINSTALNGRRNLIINGQFQCWQRGTSITSNNSNKYTADRWHSGTNGSEDVFYTRQFTNTTDGTPFIRVRRSGTASGRMYLTQMLETSVLDFCRGKTVTLSFQARKHADFDATFTSRIATQTNESPRDDNIVEQSQQNNTLTTSFQKFTHSLAITSSSNSANGFRVEFLAEDGANSSNSYYYEVRDVQLEIGTVASEIENRSFGDELQRCDRYYQSYDLSGSYVGLCAAQCSNGTESLAAMTFRTPMRASPAMSFNNLILTDRIGYDSDISSVAVQGSSSGGISFRTTHASNSGSAHDAQHITSKNATTDAYARFDAEL